LAKAELPDTLSRAPLPAFALRATARQAAGALRFRLR
jgi:hypothetical protein